MHFLTIYNIYILLGGVFLNISELNSKIYGCQNQKEGNYTNFIMKSLEEQELNNINYKWNEINKEIKF